MRGGCPGSGQYNMNQSQGNALKNARCLSGGGSFYSTALGNSSKVEAGGF